MDTIKVKHTHIVIPNYVLGKVTELEHKLSVWNQTYHYFDPIGYVYKPDTKELLVPRGINLQYLEKLFNMRCDTDHESDPDKPAVYKLKTEPKDDSQRRGISFLIGDGNFKHTKKYSQLSLNFDTGVGKTYTAIAALTFLKTRSIVITHVDKIKNQWRKEFLDKTYLSDEYICDIRGSGSVRMLLQEKNPIYKVYLVNHQTLNAYAKNNGWDAVGEFFKHIGVGLKIFDEAHLEFENLLKIDLHTNTKRTFYLTANFERSAWQENKLFELCFKNVIRYGLEEKKIRRKHIKYLAIIFNSRPDPIDELSIKNVFGFDRFAYIQYQLGTQIFYNVLEFIIRKIMNAGKIMVMVSTIAATEVVHEYLSGRDLGKTISIYNSRIETEIKEQGLSSDIIVSIPKSLGTGADISGLKYVINTEPYTSKVTANQISGRLRSLGGDVDCGYIELVDCGFGVVLNMYKKRVNFFKGKCSESKTLRYVEGMK